MFVDKIDLSNYNWDMAVEALLGDESQKAEQEMDTNLRHLGNYELQELLGSGSLAEVWKAYDQQFQRYVAIKLFHADLQNDSDFLQRFIHEAPLIAGLHHPNIAEVYDFGTSNLSDNSAYIAYMVTKYIEGQTLAEYMSAISQQGHYPSNEDLFQIFAALSRAVDYAHAHNMVHQNIKPANILLDKHNTTYLLEGEPILTDFGLARLLGTSRGIISSWMGTQLYIAPEQAQGRAGTPYSDIYALGVILYEMCTGVQPFRGEGVLAVVFQLINATPTSPSVLNPQISPALDRVILRCLAKDPLQRFHTASALTNALAEALNRPGLGGLNRPASASDQKEEQGSGTDSTPIIPPLLVTETKSPELSQEASRSKPQILRTGLLVLLLLLLLASGLSGIYVLTHRNGSAVNNQLRIVGSVVFVSSGQTSEQNGNGENDGVIVDLQNLQAPINGRAYYAWLLPDLKNIEGRPVALGRLNVVNARVHLEYVDPNHINLLTVTSRFLVTEESASNPPGVPTLSQGAWRYYAELPQVPNPQDANHYSLLDHLRHLLAQDPQLDALNLPGGLIIWFFRNTEKVLEWSGSARDYWQQQNIDGVRNQIIRVLDYLDGTQFISQDVPQGTPIMVNPTIAPVALLEFDSAKQMPPGYLYHIGIHLQGVFASPRAADAQHSLAKQMDTYLNNVKNWLHRVHDDAVQEMQPKTDLLSKESLSLLDDMYTYARYAFDGSLDPSNNELQGGAQQIYDDSQALAKLSVMPFSPANIGV